MWHYPYPLDEEAMIAAAEVVVGEHDFTSFAAVDPERVERMTTPSDDAPTNIRKIFSSGWQRDSDELIYTVCGNGFLHHMVRNLVGTFILIGKGTITRQDLDSILASRNRSAAGSTAPASGLFMVGVEY